MSDSKKPRPTLHLAMPAHEYERLKEAAQVRYEGVGGPSLFARWAINRAVAEVLARDSVTGIVASTLPAPSLGTGGSRSEEDR